MPNPLFLFIVIQNDDGSVTVDTSIPEGVQVARQASQLDVLDSARKIASDLDRQIIVDDIIRAISVQNAPEPTPAQRVQAALAQRMVEEAAAQVDAVTEDAEKDDPEV